MGFVLILLFTQAAGYYMTCCVPVAFLAAGRPRVAYGLLSTLIGWCAISLTISSVAVGYALSSAVVLALAVYVMIEMARTEPANTEEPPALAGGSRDSDAMLPGPA